jgi:hypothetical protein
MPDELIAKILSWPNKKRRPYSNKSYYNGTKDWSSFIDGGIRVSDHWNFTASRSDKFNCVTDQKNIKDNQFWYVGVYSKETNTYNIIETYPIIQRLSSEFVKEKRKEFMYKDVYSQELIEAGRQFKQNVLNGLVFAIVDSVKIQVKQYGKRFGKPFIKYLLNDNIIKTFDFSLIN